VEDEGWLAGRIAAGLPTDAVAVAHVEQAVLVGLDSRVEAGQVIRTFA
jgi:hypothetical protein